MSSLPDRYYARRYKAPLKGPGGTLYDARGERNSRAILTEADVRWIRQTNTPIRQLATLFGVDRTTIEKARDGTNWSHLP